MGRGDFKGRGRFNVDYEATSISRALRGRAGVVGDYVDYYRYDHSDPTGDNLYDEGTGAGKVFKGPFRLRALHISHPQAPADDTPQGLYTVGNLHITCSFDALRKLGFTDMDTDNQKYLTDRVVYDGQVFRVTALGVLGQIQERDLIASMECVQVKPDELVNDVQFAHWSQPIPTIGYGVGGYGTTPYGR